MSAGGTGNRSGRKSVIGNRYGASAARDSRRTAVWVLGTDRACPMSRSNYPSPQTGHADRPLLQLTPSFPASYDCRFSKGDRTPL